MSSDDLLVEPWSNRPTKPDQISIEEALVSPVAIDHAADRLVTARVLTNIAREKRLSLAGKMAALTESAQDFSKSTEAVLDGIADKIAVAKVKRDAAAEKHHGFYDTIIKGVEDSVAAIDRLSNGAPLAEDGGH